MRDSRVGAIAALLLVMGCDGGRMPPLSDRAADHRPPGQAEAPCEEMAAQSPAPLQDILALTDVLPVLSFPIPRGRLLRCGDTQQAPSVKVVDGDPADWVGEPSRIGGTTRLDAGELIYSDFLFDSYGADDGTNATRLQQLGPLASIDQRFARLDALMQAAGDQLGVPAPVGAVDRYGTSVGLADEADLFEVRWAAADDAVYVLARWTTLTDPDRAQLLVLLDTFEGGGGDIGFGSGLTSQRFDQALLLTGRDVLLRDMTTGAETRLTDSRSAVRADGWDNALEARLPPRLFPPGTTVGVVSLANNENGVVPANVMYRDSEPVTIYGEQQQALALGAGTVDGFGYPLDVEALRSGRGERIGYSAGYHERQFLSGDNISREDGENGRLQPYGLYLPGRLARDDDGVPLDIWLHYRGGKAHSGAAWTPRLIQQLGEDPGHVVVTPRGRGTSSWYVTQAHQDVFEVLADVEGLLPFLDPRRRYLSGYSMGGFGTYLFGLLYPDMFAAGYSTSGAVTQGAWTGLGPDDFTCQLPGGNIPGVGDAENPCFIEANGGDADAQLMFRLLENARHFPLVIHHGSNDELALTPGAARMGLRLLELGYRFDMTTFLGYEHFTQAIVDEWADGAAYLHRFRTPEQPRQITYKRVPALIQALNTINAREVEFDFNPDGAWWVDDVRVREPNPDDPRQFGMIDAESFALPGDMTLPIPLTVEFRPEEPALATPVLSVGAHSTPFARVGLDHQVVGDAPQSNGFRVTLTGLRSATLDTQGMGLDGEQPMQGVVTTDGPVRLRLRNLPGGVRLQINGEPVARTGADVDFPLPAGEHDIRW